MHVLTAQVAGHGIYLVAVLHWMSMRGNNYISNMILLHVILTDAPFCLCIQRAQTEAVTFLGNQENSRALYAIPGEFVSLLTISLVSCANNTGLIDYCSPTPMTSGFYSWFT